MSEITGRKDILFLFDAENCNPNGDILNGNAPRMDDETGKGETSDVRIKRYIRDQHIREGKEAEVFVKEYRNGTEVLDAKHAARNVHGIDPTKDADEIEKEAQEKFFDLRIFGSVLPLSGKKDKKKTFNDGIEHKNVATEGIHFTGPVQFQMGQTLHRISTEFVKGTGAFASGDDKNQKTFREETFLKYGLYAVNGAIDRYNAKQTGMSEEDAQNMYRLLWQGLKQSASRSKFGQMPHLLLVVSYTGDDFIGRLHHKVGMHSDLSDEKIRAMSDYTLDFSKLTEALGNAKDKIAKIEYYISDELKAMISDAVPLSEWTELKA